MDFQTSKDQIDKPYDEEYNQGDSNQIWAQISKSNPEESREKTESGLRRNIEHDKQDDESNQHDDLQGASDITVDFCDFLYAREISRSSFVLEEDKQEEEEDEKDNGDCSRADANFAVDRVEVKSWVRGWFVRFDELDHIHHYQCDG